MRINFKQIIAFIFIAPVLFSLYASFPIPNNYSTVLLQLFVFLSTLYFFIRFLWLLGSSHDDELYFKESVLRNINSNICPLCSLEQVSNSTLSIGYRRRKWSDFLYKVYYIKYSYRNIELTTKVRICKSCEHNYLLISKQKLLSLFHVNPSIKLLKRKYGYLRGIKFPYEKWNIS